MKILTLTSDFGVQDFYLSSFKGLIYSKLLDLSIVDISHSTPAFQLEPAVFNLSLAWKNFPKGTLHCFRVGEGSLKIERFLACEIEDQFFILPDNGVIRMLFPTQLPQKIIAIENSIEGRSTGEFLANIIAHILTDQAIDALGNETTLYKEMITQQPIVSADYIRGVVEYVDIYGNLITNISQELFEHKRQDRDFLIETRAVNFKKINTHYSQVQPSDELCLFNSAKFLQLSINQGNASELLGIGRKDTIQIDFF